MSLEQWQILKREIYGTIAPSRRFIKKGASYFFSQSRSDRIPIRAVSVCDRSADGARTLRLTSRVTSQSRNTAFHAEVASRKRSPHRKWKQNVNYLPANTHFTVTSDQS